MNTSDTKENDTEISEVTPKKSLNYVFVSKPIIYVPGFGNIVSPERGRTYFLGRNEEKRQKYKTKKKRK